MNENDGGEYDYFFTGYRPIWVPYDQTAERISVLLDPHLNALLLDIKGVVSNDEWEPDWPLVLELESGSVGINTKSDWLWAFDRWKDYPFRQDPSASDLVLSYRSVLEQLGLKPLKGRRLTEVLWPVDRRFKWEIGESFLFRFDNVYLQIFDAGDCLGVKLLDRVPTDERHERIL